MPSTHWSKILFVAGGASVLTLGFLVAKQRAKDDDQLTIDEREEQKLDLQGTPSKDLSLYELVRPPEHTIHLVKGSVVISGLYLGTRLVKHAGTSLLGYGFSLTTLLLNKTHVKLHTFKLGSLTAALGCFFTTMYLAQEVGSDFGYFFTVNVVAGIPALYVFGRKVQSKRRTVMAKLQQLEIDFKNSRAYNSVLDNFSRRSIERTWDRVDPHGRGLSSDEIAEVLGFLVTDAARSCSEALQSEHETQPVMKFVTNRISALLEDEQQLQRLTSKLCEQVLPADGQITKEQFLRTTENSAGMIRASILELIKNSYSIGGLFQLTKMFDKFGGESNSEPIDLTDL